LQISRLNKLLSGELLSVISGSAYIFFCRVFGAAIAFLTHVLLARWMGAEELGRYVFAWSWLIILAVVPVSGHIAAAMRFIGQGLADERPEYIRGFIRYATALTVIATVSIALVGAIFLIASSGVSDAERLLYLAALLGVPAMAQVKLDSGMANAFSRISLAFLPNNIVRPLLFLAGLVAVWLWQENLSAVSAMWLHLAALVVVALPLSFYFHASNRRQIGRVQPVYEVSEWNRTGMSLLLLGLFTNNFSDLMVVTTGFFVPSADLGIYNAALRLALLVKFGLFAIDAFTAPALTQHFRRNEREALARAARRATKLRVLSTLIPFVVFVVSGPYVLGVFGAEFKSGYPILVILSASYLPVAAVGPATRMLGVTGYHNEGLRASLFALILWCLVAPLLSFSMGIIGAAIAGLVTLTAWSAALWFYVRRCLAINTLSFLSPRRF
jgi:O-antigen/teichoic acid export membrane protein